MRTKLKKMTALLLAVAMLMMLNFPSGIFGNIGFGLTANAEENTETNTETSTGTSTGTSTITFKALEGTQGASGENYDKLIDGNKTSGKWCVTSFKSAYIVFKASERIFVDGYTITTGDDNSTENGRNPKNWTLKGCNDYNKETKTGTWVDINTVTNDDVLKDTNYTDYDFSFAKTTTPYQYFRLEITAIATPSVNCMQMSEFTLSYNTCEHEWATEKTGTIDPTCTEGGYDVYACEKCGSEKKVPNDTPATGHNKGADGKCTNCGAYMISNADELKTFAAAVNDGKTSANAVLTADITVNSNLLRSLEYDDNGNVTNDDDFTAWTPIGYYNSDSDCRLYTGTFDGEGHTISGLYFNDTNIDYVGLFGYVGKGGSVLNVGVVDSYFSGKNGVGGVCGYNEGTITSCYNEGTVSGSGDCVGGVCGYNEGTITNCYNTAAVSGSGDCVGGVCGYNEGTITSCYNTAAVSGSSDCVGGVCGYNEGSGTVTNCHSTGAVSGSYNIGGVCGLNYGTITNCYNTGSVSGSENVGGVCGANYESTIENCYNTGSVSGSNAVGGVCGYNEYGTITNCYYLSNTAVSEAKTAAQFKSGEVAYLLSQGCDIWGQKIGTDDYPVLKGDKVYATTGCVTYNNEGDTSEKDHNYEEGICTDCGGYEEPEKDESGVYQISKVTELYWFAEYVNSGNNSVNAVLTNDITVNSDLLRSLKYDTDGSVTNDDGLTYWTPVGYYNSDSDCSLYTGTFDGQGHTISGLYFNDTNINYVGLFGYVGSITDENGNVISAGKVLNVGVVDSYFSGNEYVGGVCGDSNGRISSCYVGCAVVGKDDVGGVCGYNDYDGIIENCYSDNGVPGGRVAIGDNDGDLDNVSSKSTAQFASGAVAYLLNGSTSEGSLVWGQTLGCDSADAYPKAHTDTNTVYATTGCITYNNEGTTDEKEHHYKNERCTDCGGYKEPEKDESGVYQISKVTDLYWLADTVNSGNNSVNAVLVNDITVNEDVLKADGTLADDVSGFTSWTPIGYYNGDSDCSYYTGTFDGQGHTISGLYFNDKNIKYVGLFGYLGEDGSVSNVGIVDSYFSGEDYVSGVCGYNAGTIENCYNEGTVSGGKNYVGGVCGYNDHGTIENCYNEGTVSGSSDSYCVGGVCGETYYGTIENCYNTGTVSGIYYVGGVCGENYDSTITGCYNEGTVSGSGTVSGVCGANSNSGKITNCYNEGTVSGSSDSYCVSGVCGRNYGTIGNCYNTGSVSGGEGVGGVCGNNNGSGKITNCYSTGAVDGKRLVGGVCGFNSSSSTITNCYYLAESETDDIEGTTYKTAEDFQNGTICGLVDYHSHQNGICIWCGGYEPATLTKDKYDINGDDKTDEVYEISSAGQLYWFADKVNNENETYGNANAVLTADITVNKDVLKADGTLADDVSGFTSWTPIGYIGSDFRVYTGTFDGAGHTISGLYFNDTNIDNVGLFGYVGTGGSVLNVGVVDSYFSGSRNVGGVCGYNCESTIENCYNTGSVSGSGNSVGGVCGFNYSGRVTNSYNTGSVSGSGDFVGGVCGQNYGGTVTNCYNTGSVSGSGYYVGGVCGQNLTGTITNCYYLEGCNAKDTTFTCNEGESKTTEKFAGGEVAYILQSAQTAATESGTIPQVWGQKLTGETKDASPVLTSNSAKKVYKVTFATQSNPTYAVKYANPSGVYELPTAPETDNSNYGFYKWSKTNAADGAAFTDSTAVTEDITVYAVSSEKYGENETEKSVTTTYGIEKTQDLSAYTVFATGATSAGKFTYIIESGNDTKLGATIDNDTLTIPSTAAAGTYTLTIKATAKEPEVSLMSDDLGTEPFTFEVAVTIEPITEDTPNITVNYTDETLTGFDTNGSYAIDDTDVTPTNGALAVESYIGQTISIVKKASDTNHADSTAQSLEIPARPTAPTGISATKASGIDASDGTITNVNDTMEYKAANADAWQSVTDTQITGLAAGSYKVRYKATQAAFASASAAVTISVVGKLTITFENYDNTELQTVYVTEGSMPQYTGETPTKPSDDKYTYTFAGWEPEVTAVTENATYTAKFISTPRVYNVTLEANGGEVENEDNYKTYSYGKGLILPTPTKENYYFDGWYDNEDFEGEAVVTVSAEEIGDKTYYAKWTEEEPTEYLITFVNYDNSVLQSGTVSVGATPVYNGETPTRPDDDKYTYTFVGWSPEITEVTGIATYAAQFERTPINYYVELTDEVKATVLAPKGGNCLLIFAAYDANGVMTDIELRNITFNEAGEQEFAHETLDTSGAVKIKVMLWSNIGEISPKCSSDEMSLQ